VTHNLKKRTYRVRVELTIRTDIEQTAGCVIGPSTEGIAIGEELNRVDIRLVASKGLHGLARADIPEFCESIAGAGDEDVLIGRVDADTHDVSEMVGELGDLGPGLDIPEHASHIAGGGQDTTVVDEAATGQVAGMTGELTGDTGRTFPGGEVVDGADVVETTASNVIAARGIGASHHPGGTERNRMNLVGRVGVPDDELTVLGGGDQMSTVGRPVHRIDFRQMALQNATRFHVDLRQRVGIALSDSADCNLGQPASRTGIWAGRRARWKQRRAGESEV